MLDTGVWLFSGLVVLFTWRSVCWWHRFGCFTRHFNYMSLLLVLVAVILVYDTYELCLTFSISNNQTMPMGLKVMAYSSFPTMWIMFALSSWQVFTHVEMIKEESAIVRDRAIQIIALPSVYGSMMLSCMTKCFVFLMSDKSVEVNRQLPLVVAEAETCTWIGGLYVAWALRQFGLLVVEIKESKIIKLSNSQDQEERAAANYLLVAHKAVSPRTWLGILPFVFVSVAGSVVTLWYLTFGNGTSHLVKKFNNAEGLFNVAGFLASCAAVYNVYVVERQLHVILGECRPFLKFLTVKILVTFSYGQLYFFQMLSWLTKCNQAEFYVFFCALLIFECFAIAVTHVFAWGSTEQWYDDEEKPTIIGESILDGKREKLLTPRHQ